MGFEQSLFYVFATITVVSSALVIGQRSPIYSVMLLIASFAALAGLYVLLDAPFVAVIQIIIYAGAILVLFLFVVMLLNAPKEGAAPADRVSPGPRRAGIALGALLAAELVFAVWAAAFPREPIAGGPDAASSQAISSVRTIGQVLYTDYAFAFEVTSLLILVAMVGAVVLAKRHV
ncbi:MAG TPA: NADH-quinone oxidoreductase subunit J [Vicinamibacterales bacterium]